MTCGSCGAVIADKAIVCYRCGAPTVAAPATTPKTVTRARRSPAALLVTLLLGIVLLAVGLLLPPDAGFARDLSRLAGPALIILAVVRLFRRR